MSVPHTLPAGVRPSRWLTLAVVLVAALVGYLPAALSASFLQFDDNFFFGPDNLEFREGLWTVLRQPIANAWLPVAHASLWGDFALAGDAPLLAHVHALLLHALAGFALARLLLRLSPSGSPAGSPAMATAAHVVAACFVLHPALCESVAWVSSRKYVLSGLFVFVALRATLQLAAGVRPILQLLVVALCAAAAMLSNATAVVLPVLAALLVWLGPRSAARPRGFARWFGPLVCFAVALPIALVHQRIAASEGTMAAGADILQRLAQAPGAYWHYLKTAVWPLQLNVLYPEVQTLAQFRADWLPGVVALAATLAAALALAAPRRTRFAGLGLLWFVAALLPFNTAFPASAIAAADRYLYLALPGLALALVSLTALLHARAPWLLAVVLLPILAWLCGSRAHAFGDDTTLWQASLAVDDNNAVAHLNAVYDRMQVRRAQGRAVTIDEIRPSLESAVAAAEYPIHELRARMLLRRLALAEADYEASAQHARAAIDAAVKQRALETHDKRIAEADVLLLQARLDAFEPLQLAGEGEAADRVLAEAKDAAPDHPQVIAFAAMRELSARQPELLAMAAAGEEPRLARDDARAQKAEERLRLALEQHPDHAGLWLAKAMWHRVRRQVTVALRCYRESMRCKPDEVLAYLGAARMLRDKRLYSDAANYARQGFEQRPDPRLLQERALALVGQNRLREAEQVLTAYLQFEPDDRDAGKILSNLLIGHAYEILSDNERRAEVEKLVADALRYNKDEAKARLVLGRLAQQDRRFAAAVQHLEAAYAKLPKLPEAREQLARSLAALGFDEMLRRDEEGASDAWLRCRDIAPPGFDIEGVEEQLRLCWQRLESRGVERLGEGDKDKAIEDFRRCLRLQPDQHWAAWLLAMAQHGRAGVDLDEQVELLTKAVAWQHANDLDASRQVYLLARTLQLQQRPDEARQAAAAYLKSPSPDADAEVLAALRQLAE
ncbi:MAG: hypothetical protein AB8H80_19495 [Planctomycetota bacterium]